MVTLFNVIVLVCGIVVFLYKDKLFPYYGIAWLVLFPYIYDLLFKLEGSDSYYNIIAWINYYSTICLVIKLCQNKRKLDCKFTKLLLWLFIFLCYSILLSLVRNTDLIQFLRYAIGNILNISFFLVLIDLPVSSKNMFFFIRKLNCFELIICLFQSFNLLLYSFSFSESIKGISLISGTFSRGNILGDVMLLMVIFQISYKYIYHFKFSYFDYFIYFGTLYFIYKTGTRTPFILMIISLVTMFIYHNKNNLKLLIILSLLSIFIYSNRNILLKNDGPSYDWQVEKSEQRQELIVNMLTDKNYVSENTTLYLSAVLCKYFFENPIFGVGNLFKSDSGYGGVVSYKASNLTDATLMLFLCEFGFFGLLLLFILFSWIIKYSSKRNYFFCIYMLIMNFLITITDPGIFFIGNMIYFYLLVKIGKNDNERRPKEILQSNIS